LTQTDGRKENWPRPTFTAQEEDLDTIFHF
jgi:hypothetical protein